MEGNGIVVKRWETSKEWWGCGRQRSGVRLKVRLRKWPRESRERYVVWQASRSFSWAALVNPALRACDQQFTRPLQDKLRCFKKKSGSICKDRVVYDYLVWWESRCSDRCLKEISAGGRTRGWPATTVYHRTMRSLVRTERGRVRQCGGNRIPEWAASWNAIPPVTRIRRASESVTTTTAPTEAVKLWLPTTVTAAEALEPWLPAITALCADMLSALPIPLCLSSKFVR